jgi:hypothetical protein
MSSQRQIEANRRNAQKSTGPTSVTGKAVSSMNALKSGIHAKSLVLPPEKLADLEQLIGDYYQHHDPDSPEARFYLDEVIHCEWLLRRYRTAETQMWAYENESSFSIDRKHPLGKSAALGSNHFSKLQYRVDATRRAYHRALKAVKELQAEAAVPPAPLADPLDSPAPSSVTPSLETTSPQIGFVLPSPSKVPLQPVLAPPSPYHHSGCPHEIRSAFFEPSNAPQFRPSPSPAGAVAVSRNFPAPNGLY